MSDYVTLVLLVVGIIGAVFIFIQGFKMGEVAGAAKALAELDELRRLLGDDV